MTAPEPPAEPEPRPISEIIDQLLAMNAELDRKEGLERGGGPARSVIFRARGARCTSERVRSIPGGT